MDYTLNSLLTTAAFISAGMHGDVAKLDMAREAVDTGCLEFVFRAVTYSEYIEALFEAGKVVSDDHGMVDYEVTEALGAWYVEETLRTNDWPAHGAVCTELLEMYLEFFGIDTPEQHSRLVAALNAVPAPTAEYCS